MNLKWRGLRRKLVLWVWVPATILLVLLGSVTNTAYQQIVESLTTQRDRELAQLASRLLAQSLDRYRTPLQEAAGYLTDFSDDPTAQQAWLEARREMFAAFDAGVIVLNRRGIVTAAYPARSDALGQNWSISHPYFAGARDALAPVISNILPDGPQGASVIVVATPILSAQNRFAGVIAGMVRVDGASAGPLAEGVARLNLDATRTLYGVDGEGRALYHPDPRQIGARLTDVAGMQRVLSGKAGASQLTGPDGEAVVAAYAPIPGAPWGLVIHEPWRLLVASSRAYRWLFFVLLLLVWWIPIIVVLTQARSILQPLAGLQEAVKAMSEGRYPLTLGVRTGDELEALATELGTLAAALHRRDTDHAGQMAQLELTETSLRERETNYRQLFEGLPIPIFRTAPDGEILDANTALAVLLGYPAERAAVVGINVMSVYSDPQERETWRALLEKTALVRDYALQLRRLDGTLVNVRLNVRALRDAAGALLGYEGCLEDMTRQQQAEMVLTDYSRALEQEVQQRTSELAQALKDAQALSEAAEAANRTKSAFLANMSHELRTPLNSIIGYSEMLVEDAQQMGYGVLLPDLQKIQVAGRHLLALIDDILDFSKIEAGRLELERQPFDLRQCLEASLDLVAPRAAEKRLELSYIISAETPAAVIGDVTRLRQVITNLLGNAVKFTESGEIKLVVTAHSIAADTHIENEYELHVAVQDTGIGIPPERLERLFQPFSQVDSSTTRKYGGTGLGLAISQRLVALMDGRIWVESVVGRSSTFHFTVRLTTPPAIRSIYWAGEQPQFMGKRVLVVEHNPTNREFLALQLMAWRLDVVTTGSGREVLARLRQGERFDLLLLGARLLDMTGPELAEALAALADAAGADAPAPLVLLVGLHERESSVPPHFAALLLKPVKAAALYEICSHLLAGAFSQSLLPVAETPPAPETRSAPARPDPQMGQRYPLRILLAEDNPVNQELALLMLDRLGYTADVVGTGVEVLRALALQSYDVVLMDVQMPELDGMAATRRVRETLPAAQQPHIIAMTANALHGDRERCLEVGMNDYISKPIQLGDLVGALQRTATAQRRADRAAALVRSNLTETPPPLIRIPPAAIPADVLDVAVLEQLRHTLGKRALKSMPLLIDSFHESAQRLIAEARQALRAGNLEVLHRNAHTLKSTSAAMGATSLSTLARELEDLSREAIPPDAADRLDAAEAEYARVKAALETYRQQM